MVLLLQLAPSVESKGQTSDSLIDVRVGLYLADLVDINGSSQAFQADVIMIASWTDQSLIGTFKKSTTVSINTVWHPELLIVNRRQVNKSLPEVVKVDPNGNVRYMQRITGTFSAALNLRSFPLDQQELNIWVVAPILMGSNVNLLVDKSITILRNDQLSIIDWHIYKPHIAEREFTATANSNPAPGVELSIGVKRKFGYYVIQIIIPLVAIMLMAWSVFWIEPGTVNVRVGVVVTTMLTLIAYRFALSNNVPRLSYLTRLDWFLLGATGIVMLALGTMAYSSFLVTSGKVKQVEKMDWYGRILYPLLVLGFTLFIWLL